MIFVDEQNYAIQWTKHLTNGSIQKPDSPNHNFRMDKCKRLEEKEGHKLKLS